jgi:transcriptional regulator with XRE-family HTH domain
MKSSEIKKLMTLAGVSQSEIAGRLGVTKGLVYQVINGIRFTKRVRQAIADAVGKSVEELWGNEMSIPSRPSPDLTSNPILSTFELTDREGVCSTSEIGNTEPKEIFIPLSEFIDFTEVSRKETSRTIYRHLHSGKLGYSVKVIRKKKKGYYFIGIRDKEVIKDFKLYKKACNFLKKKDSLQGEKIKKISIRIPDRLGKYLNWVSSPNSPDYREFYRFIGGESTSPLPIKIDIAELNYFVKKRIRIREEDYRKVLKITENNNLTVSKVIEIFLERFAAQTFRVSPEGNHKINKGGSHADMLLTI